jgi:hypothetical protein
MLNQAELSLGVGIFQDNNKDWEAAAASMADIYENASITIAATCSNNSDRGLFSTCPVDMVANPVQNTGLFVRRRKHPFPTIFSKLNDDLWPLFSRAWVFQERKLSPRVIHLASDQLYWECRSSFLSEDGEVISTGHHYNSEIDRSYPKGAWNQAVQQYSRLRLTYDGDRLPAISALVQRLQPLRENDTYVAGMWMSSLLTDLIWVVPSESELVQRRPTGTYPTWSWISVKQGVFRWSTSPPLNSVQLVKANYKITGPAHVGHAENASITLIGLSINLEFSTYDWSNIESSQKPFHVKDVPESLENAFGQNWQSVDFDYRTADPPILPGQKLALLLLCKSRYTTDWNGIVLRSIEPGVYERVGFMTIEPRYDAKSTSELKCLEDYINSLPTKQFKIV